MNPIITVWFFGAFEFHLLGKRTLPNAWPRRKVQTLFKILCSARGHVFTQDQLIEALFPDLDADKARQNLYNRISELRRFLEPQRGKGESSQFIARVGQRDYCFLKEAPCWVDTEEFVRLAESGRELQRSEHWAHALEAYQQALDLYRGEYLVEDLYEEWSLPHRELLQQHQLHALEGLGQCHIRLGDYGEAVKIYTQAIQKSPTNENLYRCLMKAQAYDRKNQQALETFHACAQKLHEVFGVEPDSETRALYLQIKKEGLATPSKSTNRNLPLPLTRFVGRENELGTISHLLGSKNNRLVTLIGPGGIGKTRLAIQAAFDRLNDFDDGVFFVDLTTIDKPEFVLHLVASTVAFTFQGDVDPTRQLVEFLQHKRMLLVLDNYEHVIDSALLLSKILDSTTHIQLLVTSRTRLKLMGETTVDIAGMAIPTGDAPDTLARQEALVLCVECIRRVDAKFAIGPDSLPHLIRICQLVQGMPLGIELAMAWIHTLSLEEIVKEIEANVNFLASDLRNVPQRHQSMQMVFNSSWKLLSDKEKDAFMRLSVFRGGMTRESAMELANTDLATLAELLNKSLLKRTRKNRYTAHRLLRQFAEAQLQSVQQAEIYRHRHLAYFLHIAEAAEAQRVGPKQQEWLEKLDADYDNFRAALEWALQQEKFEEALRLACALGWYWNTRGYFKEGVVWIRRALTGHENCPTNLRAKGVLWEGTLTLFQGFYAQAQTCFEESRSRFQEIDEADGVASAFNGLGLAAHFQGDYPSARQNHEQSLQIRMTLQNQNDLAESYNNLGLVLHYQGDLAGAKHYHQQSLAIRRQLEDRQGVARSLGNLANIALDEGDVGLAQKHYAECLVIAKSIGDQRIVATTLGNLGELFRGKRQYERSKKYVEEKLTLDRAMFDRKGEASSLNNLGNIARNQGQIDLAIAYHRASLKLAHAIGDKRMIYKNILTLGRFKHDPHQAAQLLGAYEAQYLALGAGSSSQEKLELAQIKASVVEALGSASFSEAFEHGATLSLDAVVALARQRPA